MSISNEQLSPKQQGICKKIFSIFIVSDGVLNPKLHNKKRDPSLFWLFALTIINMFYVQSILCSDEAISLSPTSSLPTLSSNKNKNDNFYSWENTIELSETLFLSLGKNITIAIIDSGIDTENPILSNAMWQNRSELKEVRLHAYNYKSNSSRKGNLPKRSNITETVNIVGYAPIIAYKPFSWEMVNNGLDDGFDNGFDNGLDDDCNGYIDDINGWNFGDNNNNIADYNGHGTNVAGILLKCAPKARLMVLKINKGDSNTFYTEDVVKALYYAVKNGANLINMSLSLTSESGSVKEAIQYAVDMGVMVISAAGNSNDVSFPGTIEEVITVGATIADGSCISWNSPTGSAIDITAPGKSVETINIGGDTNFVSGTSFSTPMVSGTIAVLLGMNQNLKQQTIEYLIFNGANDIGISGKDDVFGWGVLNGNGIKKLAMPSITVLDVIVDSEGESEGKGEDEGYSIHSSFEISCYLPPTDIYTDVYIALVKEKSDGLELDFTDQESIWWLDNDGKWKAHTNVGVLSVGSLYLYNKGLYVSLFSNSNGVWKNFSSYGFEHGGYKFGIAVIGESGLLAPVFWSETVFF